MEGLSVEDANLVMCLHQSKSRNVSQSILRELGSLLFKSSMKSRDREWLGDKTVDEGATPMSYDNHIKMSKKRRITE
ncbi:Nucleic acid-binding protein [Gossypium australe]|uniref:Nucleic acid-binding protein n=1 Tax=Gossypium australe TaxID=47621 RepID=A0A5B6WSZ7_9ROSI|nr:Nucleic acid-binding protein [Gossypium australe]